MSKKKSPHKLHSPPADDMKADEATPDAAGLDQVKDDNKGDNPVIEPAASQPPEPSDSASETPVLPQNPATPLSDTKPDTKPDNKSGKSPDNSSDKNAGNATDSSSDQKPPAETRVATKSSKNGSGDIPKVKRGFPFLGIFNLLLIIGLMAAAFYYWQMQQKTEADKQSLLLELQTRIDTKADAAQLAQIETEISPLTSDLGSTRSRIDDLQQQQQALQDSTKKLFDLYGRSESDWRLAEVAYLLRISQHKLALENDFEGAALTLQAASDKIGETADPGLLPVRVLISEEIADLKTRTRPDLVGMTLLLSQLGQQIRTLKPGYQPVSEIVNTPLTPIETPSTEPTLEDKVSSFFDSLITIKRSNGEAPTTTEALIINIEEIMESNLKLTRWTVLERDDFQYRQLMQENIRLFKQYYDLDDAANNDFYEQLLQLQKSVIRPQKPAIDGSLQLLNKIISQRQNAPDSTEVSPEPSANEADDNV